MEVKLPIKVSLDIALVSNLMEQQVKTFATVRDKLFKTYKIATEKGDIEGTVKFICTEKGKEQENIMAFQDGFNELLEAKTEDLTFKKIALPKEVDGKPLQLEPSILVALVKLVEIE